MEEAVKYIGEHLKVKVDFYDGNLNTRIMTISLNIGETEISKAEVCVNDLIRGIDNVII